MVDYVIGAGGAEAGLLCGLIKRKLFFNLLHYPISHLFSIQFTLFLYDPLVDLFLVLKLYVLKHVIPYVLYLLLLQPLLAHQIIGLYLTYMYLLFEYELLLMEVLVHLFDVTTVHIY